MDSRRLLGDPRLGIAVLAIGLVAAATFGRFWLAVVVFGLLLAFAFGRAGSHMANRVALYGLFGGHLLMLVTPLQPDRYNYVVYGTGLAAVIVVAQLRKTDWLPVAPMAFVALIALSAAVSTFAMKPTPVYGLLVTPIALAAGYLIGRHSASNAEPYVLRALLWFGVGESVLAISQTVFGVSPFAALGSPLFSEPRNYFALVLPSLPAQVRMATGTFSHFNGLAAILALCTPLALWMWLNCRTRRSFLVLLLIVAGLVCTFSRGALIGAVLASMLLIGTRARRDEIAVVRASLAVLVVSAVVAISAVSIGSYSRNTGNFDARAGAWQLAISVTTSDPLRLVFGAGYGFYGAGFLAEQGAITRLHSMPVEVFAELGVLGFVLALLAFSPSIRRGFLTRGRIETALAAACLAFFIAQIFDNAFFGFQGALLMAVFGLLIASLQGGRDGRSEPAESRWQCGVRS